MNIELFIFWLIGSIISCFTDKKIRDYKDYANPHVFLVLGIFLSIVASWAMIFLNFIHDQLYIPNYIYHDCRKFEEITFEDTDYDKDGNVMDEYDIDKFGHRETYKVYTCKYCGNVRKERLQ